MTQTSNVLDKIQHRLAFGESKTIHFNTDNGIGRHGLSGAIIGKNI